MDCRYQYRYDRSTQWACHYDLFSITNNKKYGEELHEITMRENTIRMQIYINHLPLNKHEHIMMNQQQIHPYCDNNICKHSQYEETMHHYLFQCPRYEQQRQIMVNNVKKKYKTHNIITKNKKSNQHKGENKKQRHNRKIIPFADDFHIFSFNLFTV